MTTEPTPRQSLGPPLGLPHLLWLVLFTTCGILSSVCCDALWDDDIIAAYFAAGIVIMAIHSWMSEAEKRWIQVATILYHGLFLGALLLGLSLLTWFLAEVLTRGDIQGAYLWIVRLVIALFLGAIVFLLLKPQKQRGWNHARRAVGWALGLGILVGGGVFLCYFGPMDTSAYPSPRVSPYRLPWKPGIRRLCIQGNRTIISHWKWGEFAYDFVMPVGTEICAARAGQVVEVVDHNDGNGPTAPGNHVVIFHEDGTHGLYAHIRKGGALVAVGQLVEQGDVLAESGNVGMSTLPHLHFHVQRDAQLIPFTFADVPGDGVPRMFRRYRSDP